MKINKVGIGNKPLEVLSRQEIWRDTIFLTILTILLWSLTGPKSGMGYETSLINYSNERSFLGGFIFVDPLRPFTSFSYHAANEFSKLLFNGSFFGIQIIFCAFLLGRVLAFYFIIRELFLNQKALAILASVLFATYAADGATLWVGQMNQISCSFAALLSILLLAKSTKMSSTLFLNSKFAIALVFQFFAIWSYEAVVLPLLLSGIIVCHLKMKKSLQRMLCVISWSFLPSSYGLLFAISTLKNPDSYRSSLISQDLTLGKVLTNLVTEFKSGLDPLMWFLSFPTYHRAAICFGLAITAASVFYLSQRLKSAETGNLSIETSLHKTYVSLFLISLGTFIPFALSTSATNLWRTHLIASLPLSLIVGVFLYCQYASFPGLRRLTILAIGIVIFVSSVTFFERGIKHQKDWELQRNVAVKLLSAAPCLPFESNIVLVLQKDNSTGGSAQSAFGDNYWFQEMLKLVYPNANIKGFYMAVDGTFPPGVSIDQYNSKQILILRENLNSFEILGEVPDNLKTLPLTERRILGLSGSGCQINQKAKSMYLNLG